MGFASRRNTLREVGSLGHEHRQRAQEKVNWTGTYEQVARQLLRQWELESRWNQ
jgi:hypothetical protein